MTGISDIGIYIVGFNNNGYCMFLSANLNVPA